VFDVIGDVHGQAATLRRLLARLGYAPDGDAMRHPARTAIFVGDLVDRGPDAPGAVRLVRSMVESGAARAIMGNHEWNLLAWHVRHPGSGEPLRSHNAAHTRQLAATLNQYARAGGLEDDLDWMRTLPPALDLGPLRVVHATWDPRLIAELQARHERGGRLDDADLVDTADPDHLAHEAVETVLKGREGKLPDGWTATDTDGRRRRRVRLRWFDEPADRRWPDYALQPGLALPPIPVSDSVVRRAVPYPEDAPPVIFGHYCLPGPEPTVFRDNVACVDNGAGRGWRLTCYRWDGESVLRPGHLVSEAADPPVTG
jgi:hypothetical protein